MSSPDFCSVFIPSNTSSKDCCEGILPIELKYLIRRLAWRSSGWAQCNHLLHWNQGVRAEKRNEEKEVRDGSLEDDARCWLWGDEWPRAKGVIHTSRSWEQTGASFWWVWNWMLPTTRKEPELTFCLRASLIRSRVADTSISAWYPKNTHLCLLGFGFSDNQWWI